MTREEIISGLRFTVDMFLLDPNTGKIYEEPRNDMDKTTIDACKGAIKLLERTRWIPVTERLPKIAGVYRVTRCYPGPNYIVESCFFDGSNTWHNDIKVNHERPYADNVIAWQEDPEPYEIGVVKNERKTKSKEI